MSFDLEGELSRLAQSVHDDGAGDRMHGQVRHMVGRIKRRRAARRTATGAVGVGAVAAVALGGMQLAGRPDGSPPAAPTAGPQTGFGQCGSTITDPNPGADPVVGLDAFVREVSDEGLAPFALLDVSFTGQTEAIEDIGEIRMVAARDQVVVSPLATLSGVRESFPPSYSFEQSMVSCEDGSPLSGSYEIYALQELSVQDASGLTQVLGGAWVVTIGEPSVSGPTAEPEPEPDQEPDPTADAQAALDAMVASPVQNPGLLFPRCGTVAVEALDDGMPVIELDLVDAELTLPSGGSHSSTVLLHTTEGAYAIGNASPNATLVVLKDGVVVGYQWLDPEGLTDVDLADGQMQEFPVLATMNLCGTGEGGQGPAVPLPAGEYTMMAALDVMMKESGYPGAEPDGRTYTITAVSEPRPLTVTQP